jgi:hypothetical protein
MHRHWQAAAVGVLSTVAVGLVAVPASAVTPRGQGLLEAESIDCPDLGGTIDKIEPAGLAPSQWTTTGQHLVVEQITFTTPDGSSTEHFGSKAGLETTTCTAVHTMEDGSVITATVTYGLLPS